MKFLRALSTELKRRVFSLSFAVSVMIVTLAFFMGGIGDSVFETENIGHLDVLYFWDIALHIGYFTPICVLCCTALNCATFLNDYRPNYYRSAVVRSGQRNYLISKFISCVITGGLTLCLGMVLFVLILSARLPLVNEDGFKEMYVLSADKWFVGGFLKNGCDVGFFAAGAFLGFLFGALWAAVGICASAFIDDKYVASFSPYVIWYALRMILKGIFNFDNVFESAYNFGGIFGSLLWAVGYFGIIIAALGTVFCVKAGRRCEA